MLVVIEGLDGSGKSTQVKRLRSYLESRTDNLEYIHFPRYDSPVYGELIGKFLRGGFGSIDSVHPQLDRYVYSNIAYQCAKIDDPQEREALRKWIFDTEYGQFGLPKPDLNIFLDVPIGFVEKKLEAGRKGDDREYLEGKTDIHEADIEFQKRVREVYVSQCEMDPDFIRIDCRSCDGSMLPPDEIAAAIMATVDGKR